MRIIYLNKASFTDFQNGYMPYAKFICNLTFFQCFVDNIDIIYSQISFFFQEINLLDFSLSIFGLTSSRNFQHIRQLNISAKLSFEY